MPARLESPADGRSPTRQLCELGNSNRAARIGAHRERGQARGCRCAGSAARSARRASHVVRIQCLSTKRADTGQSERELVEIHFTQEHSAGQAQFGHLKRVARGDNSSQRERPARRRHVSGFEVVFEQNGNAVQRTTDPSRLPLLIEGACRRGGIRVDGDDRVQPGPGLVVRGDASEIEFDELLGCDLSGGHGRLQIPNALLADVERLDGLRPPARAGHAEANEGGTRCLNELPSRRSLHVLIRADATRRAMPHHAATDDSRPRGFR